MRSVFIAVALAACVSNVAVPVDVAPSVDARATLDELRIFVQTYGERADNLPAHAGAREHIARAFQESGLEVWTQAFETDIPQQNIVGIKWGKDPASWVVVGGHYDMATRDCNQVPDGVDLPGVGRVDRPGAIPCGHRPFSQGAYDDGSGVMMTLELARAFAPLETQNTIAFVAFDGEERGLEGSGNFSEAILDGRHPYGDVSVRGMVDLDMIGLNWPGVDAPIFFDSNAEPLRQRMREDMERIDMPADMTKFQGISLGRSDYHWFMEMGVPTAFFISDFEEWQAGDTPNRQTCVELPTGMQCSAYPFWHLEDTYDTMLVMAGSEEDLEDGFQTALDLAAGQVAFLAGETPVDIDDP